MAILYGLFRGNLYESATRCVFSRCRGWCIEVLPCICFPFLPQFPLPLTALGLHLPAKPLHISFTSGCVYGACSNTPGDSIIFLLRLIQTQGTKSLWHLGEGEECPRYAERKFRFTMETVVEARFDHGLGRRPHIVRITCSDMFV